uniref:Uncharacterized protein n=1 Tax=viral metagenome TaxID=1070528 RepID=A0A6C0CKS6_9ZZZZ
MTPYYPEVSNLKCARTISHLKPSRCGINIYGDSGSGKTVLAKQIVNKFLESNPNIEVLIVNPNDENQLKVVKGHNLLIVSFDDTSEKQSADINFFIHPEYGCILVSNVKISAHPFTYYYNMSPEKLDIPTYGSVLFTGNEYNPCCGRLAVSQYIPNRETVMGLNSYTTGDVEGLNTSEQMKKDINRGDYYTDMHIGDFHGAYIRNKFKLPEIKHLIIDQSCIKEYLHYIYDIYFHLVDRPKIYVVDHTTQCERIMEFNLKLDASCPSRYGDILPFIEFEDMPQTSVETYAFYKYLGTYPESIPDCIEWMNAHSFYNVEDQLRKISEDLQNTKDK